MIIALSGYYGFDNAGDEALLAAITSSIGDLAPGVEFIVLSGDPENTFKSHGIPAVYYKSPWQVMKALKKCDLLISGGGSIFQDITSALSLPYYISVVALAKLMGKPVMFYAQGVGPIRRPISRSLMRLVANRVDLISLRDQDSARLLQEIGVVRPPVRLTADPVLALQPDNSDLQAMIHYLATNDLALKPIICVSVRSWPALEGYQPELAQALDQLVQCGYNILFVPMAWPEDISESNRIMSYMKEKSFIIDRKLGSQELLALISRSTMLIGMRLHALIFAASQGVLFAGISYDPKVEAFLASYSMEPLPQNADRLLKQVRYILESKDMRATISHKSEELRSKSRENAFLALSLVKRGGEVTGE